MEIFHRRKRRDYIFGKNGKILTWFVLAFAILWFSTCIMPKTKLLQAKKAKNIWYLREIFMVAIAVGVGIFNETFKNVLANAQPPSQPLQCYVEPQPELINVRTFQPCSQSSASSLEDSEYSVSTTEEEPHATVLLARRRKKRRADRKRARDKRKARRDKKKKKRAKKPKKKETPAPPPPPPTPPPPLPPPDLGCCPPNQQMMDGIRSCIEKSLKVQERRDRGMTECLPIAPANLAAILAILAALSSISKPSRPNLIDACSDFFCCNSLIAYACLFGLGFVCFQLCSRCDQRPTIVDRVCGLTDENRTLAALLPIAAMFYFNGSRQWWVAVAI